MDSFALFPHGNIISEISLLRKELINFLFNSELKKYFKITPLFSTFAILDFYKETQIDHHNEISDMFVKSKIKPCISKIQFDGKYFFVDIIHPILTEANKTDLEFLPYTNRFNLAKIDFLYSKTQKDFYNTEKNKIENLISSINWDEKSLRVFQIAKILSESILQENNSFSIKTEKKKWIKIN